jgi:hypothetical protein
VRLTRILLAHDRAEGSDVTSRFRALREAASGRLTGWRRLSHTNRGL